MSAATSVEPALGPHLLICEDNADLAENLLELAELLGLGAVHLPSVQAARAHLAANDQVILLVTDLRIGEASGLELARQARDLRPPLPVILVSGFLDDEARAQADDAGVRAMFSKPIDHEALLAEMSSLADLEAKGRAPTELAEVRSLPEPSLVDPSGHAEVLPLQGSRVLIVDDNKDHAENLAEFLESLGAQTRLADSCAVARAKILNEGVDVALVDIRLPDGSGVELVEPLRSSRVPAAEVLLMTGYASVDGAITALSQGANAYLLKPIDLGELRAAVTRATNTVHMRQRSHELTQQLKESETQLRALVDHARVLLVALDDQQRIVQTNAALARLSGHSQAALVGRDWVAEFVPEYSQDARRNELKLAAHEHVDQPSLETIDAADGSTRRISWLTRALPSPEGTLLYRAGIDVTEQRAAQARAQRAEKLAAVGTLAAGLAHEIRNPLNGASLQLQVLERRMDRATVDVEWRGPVTIVREEIARLGRLVEEFMSFARPRALAVRTLALDPLLERVATLSQQSARDRGVELCMPEGPCGLSVSGDLDRLSQVLLNLVRNAIEASEAGQRVEVSVMRHEDEVWIAMRDYGPGIPESALSRVYEPFFTTKQGGTGLGLPISHSIVEQHGGRIQIDVDGGTRVVVCLPLASGPTSAAPA